MIETLKQWTSSLLQAKIPLSPDRLTSQNPNNPDVRRITEAPLVIFGILAIIISIGIFVIAYSKAASFQKPVIETEADPKVQSKPETPDWFTKKQQEGVIGSIEAEFSSPVDLSKTKEPTDTPNLETAPPPSNQAPTPMTPYQEAQFQAWQHSEQLRQQMEEMRRTSLQSALQADTTIYSNPNTKTTTLANGIQAGIKETNFASNQSEAENYLLHTRIKAVSPYEVKAGTVIPSVMLGGVNSNLPGQITAQVAQNVYDTATGQYLLIPQGTKLVGNYDHQVVTGQSRVLVIWNRLIYPDASSVNLVGMPGSDQSGYAGFKGKTNNHFWPTFRNALMLSAITAGVQLSQPRTQQGDFSYSSQQMAAGALGQQMAQLGMATVGRGFSQAPTLTIRPGYVFNVMINKDIILPPWQPETAQW
jgi:type IV secretion system protein VirB10